MADLRAYNPTLRDRLASAVLGDTRASDPFGRVVEALLGSTGLGTRGMGLADFTPAGMAFAAEDAGRSLAEGDYAGAAMNALGAIPGGAVTGTVAKGRDLLPRKAIGNSKVGYYDIPAQRPRPFDADYPYGAEADGTGALTRDIEGRPLSAPTIAGRTHHARGDAVLGSPEVESIGAQGTGQAVARVARGTLPPGTLGSTRVNTATGEPSRVRITDGLAPDDERRVLFHETGHVIDQLAGAIDPEGLYDELEPLYSRLATGQDRHRNLVTPQSRGYTEKQAPREYMAEAIRSYMRDPNAMKTVAPNTAARIREHVNSNPRLNKIVQFNALPATIAAGAAGSGLASPSEAQASEKPMADLARIKNNVRKMAEQNAPAEDIDGYIASEGVTLDDVRNFQGGGQPAMRHDDALSEVRTASGGFLEGIPVVGPMIRGGVERAAAATLAPFSDKSYGEVLETIQKGTGAEKKANPWLDTGAQITGAVAGTVPMVMAAPAAFGAGGGSLASRSILGGLSGMGLGGADSAVRSGGDVSEIGRGMMVGGGMGTLAPIVGQGVGAGVRGFRDWRATGKAAKDTGIDRYAISRLGRAAADDALDPAAIASRMDELGPDAMLMDLGPNLQRQAGALAATPGPGQEITRSAIKARDAGATTRITGALDDTLGQAVTPNSVEAGIRTNQQALSPAYRQAFQKAMHVDPTPIAKSLDMDIRLLRGDAQKAAQRIRSMLNAAGTDQLETDPRVLFQIRQAIDDMSAANIGGNSGRFLSETRQAVDDLLTRTVPGIKDIDAQFAELARQKDAFARGQQVLDSGRTAPRPQELADEFSQAALPQNRQIGPSAAPLRMQQGARDEIERIVGTNANDRVALQRIIKGEGDWNRQRLATLFGQEKADRIISVLDRERLFADTSQVITRNSETAARLAAQQEVAGNAGPQFGVREGYMSGGLLGGARSMAIRGAERVADALFKGRNNAGNSALAEALATPQFQRVVEALQKAQGRPLNQQMIDEVTRSLMIGGGQSAVRP